MWCAFGAVHAWLAVVGVVVIPGAAFNDLNLYRFWVATGLQGDGWPVLDGPFVYPAGALVPMLVAALGTTASWPGYALAWCLMVLVLDAVALAVLLGPGGLPWSARSALPTPDLRGGWWWTAFLLLLGPVAMGRLDAVAVPVMVVALTLAARATDRGSRLPAALATAGAWVKVAPGVLLLPLAAAARRPWRDVVVPAAAVSAVVAGAVAITGGADGLGRIAGFMTEQRARGLQIESVTATPWVVAAPVRDDVELLFDHDLITWQVAGPGAATAARLLDLVLLAAVAVVGVALVRARRRGGREVAAAALLPASLTLITVLLVANKVGSPQLVAWLAAPLAVAVTVLPTAAWVRRAATLALLVAGLTQLVFPWSYGELLAGDGLLTVALTVRNLGLLGLLVLGAAALHAVTRDGDPDAGAEPLPRSDSLPAETGPPAAGPQ